MVKYQFLTCKLCFSFMNFSQSFPQHHPIFPALGSPTGPLQVALFGGDMAGNMPCSTLFVANLEKDCSEQQLRDVFGE